MNYSVLLEGDWEGGFPSVLRKEMALELRPYYEEKEIDVKILPRVKKRKYDSPKTGTSSRI